MDCPQNGHPLLHHEVLYDRKDKRGFFRPQPNCFPSLFLPPRSHFLALLLPYWFILHLLVCSPPESRYLIPASHLRHKVRRNGGKHPPPHTHTQRRWVAVLNSPVSLPKQRVPNRRWQCCRIPWTLSFTLSPSHTHTLSRLHLHQHVFSLPHRDSHLKYNRKTFLCIFFLSSLMPPPSAHTPFLRRPNGCIRCVMDLLQEYSHYNWPDLAFSTSSSYQELSRTDFCTLPTLFFSPNLCVHGPGVSAVCVHQKQDNKTNCSVASRKGEVSRCSSGR